MSSGDTLDALAADKDYQKYFDPSSYLKTYAATPASMVITDGDLSRTLHCLWRDVFSSGDIKGDRLLDIGCGPCIYASIPASRCFKNIYLSEIVDASRDAIRDWLQRRPQAHDWTPFFKFYSEKEEPKISWQDAEERVRAAIKDVLPCNVLKENPLDPVVMDPFDGVMSNLSLEAAANNAEEYKAVVKHAVGQLKPGGHYFQQSIMHATSYRVGNASFVDVVLTADLAREAVEAAGCSVISLKTCTNQQMGPDGGFVVLHARKNDVGL